MNKYFFIFLTALCGMLAVGCSSDNDSEEANNEPPKEITLSRSQQDIVDSQARFAFDFFKQTSAWAGNNKNMVISPLSLSIDLAMLANGAGERTYQDITAALHLPNATVDELNELYEKLVGEMLSADRKVELSIANGIWSDNNISIKDGFVNNIKNHYTADIQSLDFSDEIGSKNAINRWASEKTKGNISNIFDQNELLSNTHLIVCNALSFNGKWTVPFDKKHTRQVSFTNIDNRKTKVDMMIAEEVSNTYSHVLTESAEIVRLPYGNRTFSMYILLPSVEDKEGNYEQIYDHFIENLDYDWWVGSKGQMTHGNRPITVHLPKFRVETLCPMIGLTILPNLSNITLDPDMSIMTESDINMLALDQYNSIEVTESGTVAASVSKGGLINYDSLVTFVNVNRPFIFLIEEGSTGAILFMGKVTKL
ncbi:MAG: hypothetical protein K2G00_07840 [Duncaniella sp.]|nr:hypothetical protein [Duncaniella sp.]